MVAYHGKPELKIAFLAEIGKHEAADRIQHTGYANFKTNGETVFSGGCAVGCSLESMRVIEGLPSIVHSDHALYERYLGVPVMLARLEDRIFEGLPLAESLTWPRRFADAIRPGADLSMVGPRFLHDLLTTPDGAVQRRAATHEGVKASVEAVAALFARWFETGTKPSVTEWREAKAAAAAAAATAAAYAATAAAYAAYAAADAATADAYAAAYAAHAAASGGGDAARSQEFARQATALIRLLEAA